MKGKYTNKNYLLKKYFAAPTRIGLRGHTFTNRSVKPVAANMSSALSSPVLEQTNRGNCDRHIRGDIQVSAGRKMVVPLPRSSPVTRPQILRSEFFPPCRIPPLCY